MRLFKLRYSLRTFFVVIALVACWLGYQLRIKQQRTEQLVRVTAHGGYYTEYDFNRQPSDDGVLEDHYKQKAASVSNIRLWLGDKAVKHISLWSTDLTQEDQELLKSLFPEATIIPRKALDSSELRQAE